jgi:tetratricopeptide (TPR) repeat protein
MKALYDEHDDDHELNFHMGRAYLLLGNYEDAISHLETTVEANNDSVSYYNLLAKAYATKIEDSGIFTKISTAPKVRDCWEQVIRLDSNEVELRIRLVKFYLLAPGLIGGNEDRGFQIVDELMRLEELSARQLLLEYYVEEDEYEKAREEFLIIHNNFFLKNIVKSRNNPIKSDYIRYGYYLMREEKHDECVFVFSELTRIAPNDPNSFDSLGEAYKLKGEVEKAREMFEKALIIDPTFKPSLDNIKNLQGQRSR